MEREVYDYLYNNLNEHDDIQRILQEKPGVASYNTLMSIYSQKYQEHTRKTLHKHRKPHMMAKYYERYLHGESMLHIANLINVSPCLLARIILQCYLSPTVSVDRMKGEVSKRMKSPSMLLADEGKGEGDDSKGEGKGDSKGDGKGDSKGDGKGDSKGDSKGESKGDSERRLYYEIIACIDADLNYSPRIEKIRRLTGLEYENLLQQKLVDLNMPFMNEEDLRIVGYPKTPDVKLLLPFAVDGFVVNWVESKASFCDEYGLQMAKEQFLGYVNRYGSGMVIYWFGYLEDLNKMKEEGIVLIDSFPTNIVFLDIPSVTY